MVEWRREEGPEILEKVRKYSGPCQLVYWNEGTNIINTLKITILWLISIIIISGYVFVSLSVTHIIKLVGITVSLRHLREIQNIQPKIG